MSAQRLGSLVNVLMDSNVTPAKVGMPATILMWTDRHAATVIAVSKSGRKVTVQFDKATRTDTNGMSESQTYEYERDTNGIIETFYRLATGRYRRSGWGLYLGRRETYCDFSF